MIFHIRAWIFFLQCNEENVCNHQKLFFSSHFPSAKYFLCCRKLCSEQPDVFFSFSCIFGCELRVFSVNLDAEHWNLEFFWVNEKCSLSEPNYVFCKSQWSNKRCSLWIEDCEWRMCCNYVFQINIFQLQSKWLVDYNLGNHLERKRFGAFFQLVCTKCRQHEVSQCSNNCCSLRSKEC